MENENVDNKIYANKLREYVSEAKKSISQNTKKTSKKKAPTDQVDETMANTIANTMLELIVKAAKHGDISIEYALKESVSDALLERSAQILRNMCPDSMIIMDFGKKVISIDWSGNNEA